MKRKHVLLFVMLSVLAFGLVNAQAVYELSSNSFIKEYLVAGPFHQKDLAADDWPDLLEIACIENENLFGAEPGIFETVMADAGDNNTIDFNTILGEGAVAVAYAHAKVSAPDETEALFLVSAQDGAKVYVNGENVHTYFGSGWGEHMQFQAMLEKGVNNIVFKVPNRDWGWNLKVKVLDEDNAAKHLENETEKEQHSVFLHSNLQPSVSQNFGFTFYPGKFPKLVFEQPGLVEKYLGGSYDISTRWFDRDLTEVLYPKEPGRYAYYAEVTGANGFVLKKSATLYCAPGDWMGWSERLDANLEHLPVNGIPKSTWENHFDAISQHAGFAVFKSIMFQEDGAVLLSFIDDMYRKQGQSSKLNTPLIVDGDYHARLKQKILGAANTYSALKAPAKIGNNSPRLKLLSGGEREYYQALTKELMEVGNAWMDDEGGPFDIVIAKEGKIVFHESFGEDGHGKFTTETPSEIASITKLFTGMLFAQFIDQGLIGIDDPVGKYLPDFPLTGPNAVTLRHCFTHTAGFDFFAHGLYDGVHNPWLENTLIQTIKNDTVGTKHAYNGMGYDLAGKVMEVVTGKSIFRLLREYLYDPLEMHHTVHDWDLGYSVHSTAYDLAKVAQLLLNKGSYGDKQFFSEETYEKLVPVDLSAYYPAINQKWGIGITGMDWKVTDSETGEKRFLLGGDIIGHGSATASVFWVIPKHNMIITQSRRRGNRNFGPNFQKMIGVVEKHLTP